MIYAIPHNGDSVANHFMKAKQFAFIDEHSSLIENAVNPAATNNSTCSDKKATVTMLTAMKADAVVVRNIGERSLNKLLGSGMRVFQVATHTPIAEVLKSNLQELTDASQGRPSINHQQKDGCCSSHTDGEHGSSCCSSDSGSGCGCGSRKKAGHSHGHAHGDSHSQGHGHGSLSQPNRIRKGRASANLTGISALNPLNKQ